jgi:ketosteroid isomerase-like protein
MGRKASWCRPSTSRKQKDWEDFFAAFPGPVEFEISGLGVTTEGNLSFSHEINNWVVTDKTGKRVTLTIRATEVYRNS